MACYKITPVKLTADDGKFFTQALLMGLDSPNTVVSSIALKGDAFMNAIKKRRDTRGAP
jgi:hypothetical protein